MWREERVQREDSRTRKWSCGDPKLFWVKEVRRTEQRENVKSTFQKWGGLLHAERFTGEFSLSTAFDKTNITYSRTKQRRASPSLSLPPRIVLLLVHFLFTYFHFSFLLTLNFRFSFCGPLTFSFVSLEVI